MGAVTRQVAIGVDIGQRVDPTAIAVVEREQRVESPTLGVAAMEAARSAAELRPPIEAAASERRVWHHTARYLDRLPLGTPYPAVADRLARIAANVQQKTGQRATVFIDATGVGQPVVDELRLHDVPARLVAVYFTYGDRRIVEHHGRVTLGKAYLVSRMQALFQGNRLHLPPGHPEAETLVKELLDYEIRVDQDANDKYGAFKVGTHDDLVTALGLAVQTDGAPLEGVIARTLATGWGSRPAPTGPATRAQRAEAPARSGWERRRDMLPGDQIVHW